MNLLDCGICSGCCLLLHEAVPIAMRLLIGCHWRLLSTDEEHSIADDLDEKPERVDIVVATSLGVVLKLDESEEIAHGTATCDDTDF